MNQTATAKTSEQEWSTDAGAMVDRHTGLVVSIARRYVGRGLMLEDLIQEGNIGIIKALRKYDPSLGTKFSTYASWWIRQSIVRALENQGSTIRLPVHIAAQIRLQIKTIAELTQRMGRDPTAAEVANKMALPRRKLETISLVTQQPLSFESRLGHSEEVSLHDVVGDQETIDPLQTVIAYSLVEETAKLLSTLADREQLLLRMRFGLGEYGDRGAHTLEQIGQVLGVTRERVRQMEATALRKLRHPNRSRHLRCYMQA